MALKPIPIAAATHVTLADSATHAKKAAIAASRGAKRAVDGPDDIDEKLLEPLERAWRRPVTAPVEDASAARHAH